MPLYKKKVQTKKKGRFRGLCKIRGGCNTATAGAQMQNITVKDALDQLVASIDRFYET